ncbi:MAG: TrkH family potassium uptake protein [Pegethrix bostrychoides GSE-TBD4-15B]|jgi:trk system potassium uptake protein TrkH|uniref:TrkH family potassium uptake protein n=1 Tax=Pegethrix bostrychoides GSE-TBD4-15B TaxID=2839662 RepID=A0A951PFN0_9CYAN|nr:TrkH family potassium uptake protein [Pegethrix bostrychoides GSE-TBD4-15B]
MTVARTVCLGFIAVILVGMLLLLLPISHADGGWGNWLVALFTSTSAVCVTGLVVVDTGSYYSFWGQLFITALIQVGGLGYMTATTFLLLLLGRKFGLRDKVAIQQSLDKQGMAGADQLLRSIISVTAILELSGAFAMMPVFMPEYGARQGIWMAVFHSISAFNNAGFGLLPDSLIRYATSLPINIVISTLIILGGIGYQVIMDCYLWGRDRLQGRRERAVFSLNFKIVISTTIFLLLLGTVLIFFVESRNPGTLVGLSWQDQLLISWFQSVMPRTAGFNSLDYAQMSEVGWFITIVLMFIGASPGGTGGGLKTTTFRILYECTKTALQGKDEVVSYQRQIPFPLILKAVGVLFGSLVTVLTASTLIELADPAVSLLQVLFEVVSGFATVGLSTGITASLTVFSKLVLIAVMYVGRVGVLLLLAAVLGDPARSTVNYPEENLLVG